MNTKDNILIANSIKKELTDNTFNLELAKQGYPVCTKNGLDVKIIFFNRIHEYFPIVALIKYHEFEYESIYSYTTNGKMFPKDDDDLDLVMKISK